MTGTKRRGRYVADYYVHVDAGLRRKRLSFKTAAERDTHLEAIRDLERRRKGLSALVNRSVTVAPFARQWLAGLAGAIKPRTIEAYTKAMELYIVPRLGDRLVAELTRRDVKAFLTACRQRGVGYVTADGRRIQKPLAKGSVYAIYAALRALLNEAMEEEIIAGNPAARLGKRLHLHPSKQHMKATVEARVFSREKLRQLLEHTRRREDEAYPLVLTMARAGLRIGEVVALGLDDYEPEARRLLVARSWDDKHGVMGTPKHGARRVDVSPQLAAILDPHVAALRDVAGKVTPIDRTARGTWLFPSQTCSMLDPRNVRRLLRRLARDAGLGRDVKPHDLRHTYGSQLTAAGAPPQYIQAQLGHASIQITIDLYGSGLPFGTGETAGSYQHTYQQGFRWVDVLDDPHWTRGQSRRTGHRVVTRKRRMMGGGDASD